MNTVGSISQSELRRYNQSRKRPHVVHRCVTQDMSVLTGGLPFDVKMNVPFSVRRVDIAFLLFDGQDVHDPFIVQIEGITNDNVLCSSTMHQSPVFSLFFDPPIQVSGELKIRTLAQLEPNLNFVPLHDCGFVMNLAFHNDY